MCTVEVNFMNRKLICNNFDCQLMKYLEVSDWIFSSWMPLVKQATLQLQNYNTAITETLYFKQFKILRCCVCILSFGFCGLPSHRVRSLIFAELLNMVCHIGICQYMVRERKQPKQHPMHVGLWLSIPKYFVAFNTFMLPLYKSKSNTAVWD